MVFVVIVIVLLLVIAADADDDGAGDAGAADLLEICWRSADGADDGAFDGAKDCVAAAMLVRYGFGFFFVWWSKK